MSGLFTNDSSNRSVMSSIGRTRGSSQQSVGITINAGGGSVLSYPLIWSTYQLTKSEKNQINETFNEFSHVNAFGKAAERLNVQGYYLRVPGSGSFSSDIIKKYDTKLRAFQSAKSGSLATATLYGGVTFTGIVDSLQVSITAEQDNIHTVSFSLIGIDGLFSVGQEGTATAGNDGETTSDKKNSSYGATARMIVA